MIKNKNENYECTAEPMPMPCSWVGCKWECKPNKCPFYKKVGVADEK